MFYTVRELLKLHLAATVDVDENLSRQSSVRRTFPQSLKPWPEFLQIVRARIEAALQGFPDTREFDIGDLDDVFIGSETDAVSQFVQHCLKRTERVLRRRHGHTSYRYIQHPRGCSLPDREVPGGVVDAALVRLVARDSKALIAVEGKQPGVLCNNTNLIEHYHDPEEKYNKVRYAVAQITQYIQELGTEFGVLSSFSRTWFFKAKLDLATNFVDLWVSPAIPWNADDTTATEVMYALSLIAIDREAKGTGGLAGGRRQARGLPSVFQPDHGMMTRSKQGSGDSETGGSSRRSGSGQGFKEANVFTADELDLGRMLGWGRDGVVKEACFEGQPAALKIMVPELAENPAMAAASFAAEQNIYRALDDVQGHQIPRLLGTGTIANRRGTLCPFLALERLVGHTLYDEAQPSQQQGRAAQHALRALHDRGVVHGDVKADNIMIMDAAAPKDGVRILDFAASSIGLTAELQLAEELELASIFSSKGITLDPLTPPQRKTSPRLRPVDFSDSD